MSLCFGGEIIVRPHSTTPTTLHQRKQHHYHQLTHSNQHQNRSRLLPNNKRPALSSPPPSSSSLQGAPHQLTPSSPLIRPTWLVSNSCSLTRTNSLPGKSHRPITHRSFTLSARLAPASSALVKRTRTSPPPPLSRLPTSPTPASAVTGASGLTVAGRMVEYNSDHSRREALSRALRAVSQSGSERSRHLHHHHHHASSGRPSPSQTASSGGENEESVSGPMTPSRRQEGNRRTQRAATRVPSLPLPTSAPCVIGRETGESEEEESGFPFGHVNEAPGFAPPGSQASGYISFASLNLLAPPSPPESTTGFLADDEQDLFLNQSRLIFQPPLSLHLPSSSSPHSPSSPHHHHHHHILTAQTHLKA
ncbi:hypothetical protein VP01_84g11 [Puccinia sorghi]|uniref:Uncharacterized protein n=1 Tax=Puccinia sorghi TaxID=27349 RepID=A0A0L6U9A1_9BASI|nr:hypothetical protein VP01_84g11 [Puccinia sorghi]